MKGSEMGGQENENWIVSGSRLKFGLVPTGVLIESSLCCLIQRALFLEIPIFVEWVHSYVGIESPYCCEIVLMDVEVSCCEISIFVGSISTHEGDPRIWVRFKEGETSRLPLYWSCFLLTILSGRSPQLPGLIKTLIDHQQPEPEGQILYRHFVSKNVVFGHLGSPFTF